jgi:hypothetical protein
MNGKQDIVFKRCGCTDVATGRQLAAHCPRLAQPGHGSWLVLRLAGRYGRRAEGPLPAGRIRDLEHSCRRPPGHHRRPGRRGRGRGMNGRSVAAVLARAGRAAPAPVHRARLPRPHRPLPHPQHRPHHPRRPHRQAPAGLACARSCHFVRSPESEARCGYRIVPGRTGAIRANMEQTSAAIGLDHHGRACLGHRPGEPITVVGKGIGGWPDTIRRPRSESGKSGRHGW